MFTEGEKTEPIYLTHWHRKYREHVVLSVSNLHGAPLSLVKTAVSERKYDKREARKGRGDPFDEYWCVFDVDVHPNIPEARLLAEQNGISLAVSNPCIELWFLLHFGDQNRHIDRHAAQTECERVLGYEKVLTQKALAMLEDGHADAVMRAVKLDQKHDGDGSPPGSNPSSGLWNLIDVIQSA